jgi:hypothetical protein
MTDRELLLKAIKDVGELIRFMDESHEERKIHVRKLLERSGARELDLMVRVAEISAELEKALHGTDKT